MNPRNLAIMLGLISVLNAKMMIVIVTMTRRRMRKEMMNLMMEMDQNKVTKATLVEDPEENQQRLNGSIPFGAETLSKRMRTNKMILTTELSTGFVSSTQVLPSTSLRTTRWRKTKYSLMLETKKCFLPSTVKKHFWW